MNILLNKLPTTVLIGGSDYAINANFRTSLLFEKIIENEEIEETEKILDLLELYYPVMPPKECIEEALNQIMWFYKCGEEIEQSKSSKPQSINKSFSYEHDCKLIYSAFLEQYGRDLSDIEYLHWWKFRALFDGLSEDTKIKKIILYRSIDLKDLKDETQKDFYKEMKEIFKLPNVNAEKEEQILDDNLKELLQYQ